MPQLEDQAPASLLDQDIYKFCMQQAVLEHYPHVTVEYGFINRDPTMRFNRLAFELLQQKISALADIAIRDDELAYLRASCPFFSAEYMRFLQAYRYNPAADVDCVLDDATGQIELRVRGQWSQVILYEIVLLALVAEVYYAVIDTDWDYSGQREKIAAKGQQLVAAGCNFAEFGTRRRRSFKTQDIVMNELTNLPGGPGRFAGTSNVYLARKYNVAPIGTVGHEWTMGIAALEGTYENGNSLALRKWYSTFHGNLGIALTDTFGTKAFFANFGHDLATKYSGMRHDSGDPFTFIETASRHYNRLGIDVSTKTIVFSDGLDPESAIAIKAHCDRFGLKCSFGIGTNFTNDFVRASDAAQKSKAVNIVIKLLRCNDRYCVKLSDDKGKHTGNALEVQRAQDDLAGKGLLA
ncbi:nicotinate phosphoribosyltransferase [Coemansia sp. RSA 552]|nr:nicotinate phosphoribosyltransferase [Coemansia sp. RSA 552]